MSSGVGSSKTVWFLSCLGSLTCELIHWARFDQIHSQHLHKLLPLNLCATCLLHVFSVDDPGVDGTSVQHAEEHAEWPPIGLPATQILATQLVKSVHSPFLFIVVLNDGWLPTAGQGLISMHGRQKEDNFLAGRGLKHIHAQHPVSTTTDMPYPYVGLQHGAIKRARQPDLSQHCRAGKWRYWVSEHPSSQHINHKHGQWHLLLLIPPTYAWLGLQCRLVGKKLFCEKKMRRVINK